jgi:multidrug efflux pump
MLGNRRNADFQLRNTKRIELAGENFDAEAKYNGQPTAAFAVKLATGANALDTANKVRAKIDELKPYFPANIPAGNQANR